MTIKTERKVDIDTAELLYYMERMLSNYANSPNYYNVTISKEALRDMHDVIVELQNRVEKCNDTNNLFVGNATSPYELNLFDGD